MCACMYDVFEVYDWGRRSRNYMGILRYLSEKGAGGVDRREKLHLQHAIIREV